MPPDLAAEIRSPKLLAVRGREKYDREASDWPRTREQILERDGRMIGALVARKALAGETG